MSSNRKKKISGQEIEKSLTRSSKDEFSIEDLFYPIKYIGEETDEKKIKEKIMTKYLTVSKIIKDKEFGEIVLFENEEKTESVTYVLCRKPFYSEGFICDTVKQINTKVNPLCYILKEEKEELLKYSLKDLLLCSPSFKKQEEPFITSFFNNFIFNFPSLNEKRFVNLYAFLNEIVYEEDVKDLDENAVKNVCHRLVSFYKDDEISKYLIENILTENDYKFF